MTAEEYNIALLQANQLKRVSSQLHDIQAVLLMKALRGAENVPDPKKYSAFLEQGRALQREIAACSESIRTASETILLLAGKMHARENTAARSQAMDSESVPDSIREPIRNSDQNSMQCSDSAEPYHEADHTGISCLVSAITGLKDTDARINEVIGKLQSISDPAEWERMIKNLELHARKPEQFRNQLQTLQTELEKDGDFPIPDEQPYRERTISTEDLEERTDRAYVNVQLDRLKNTLNGQEVQPENTETIQSRLADLEAELNQTANISTDQDISFRDASGITEEIVSKQNNQTGQKNTPKQNVQTGQKDIREQIDRWISENCSVLGEREQTLIRHFLYQAAEQVETPAVLEKAFRNYPTKEEHYRRNTLMPFDRLPVNPVEAAKQGWDNSVSANCHQFRAKLGRNEKWISPDGHFEAVYDPFGNLVTVPEDRGTYNIADPRKDMLGHCIDDMLPWILYGNTKEDTTLPLQRLLSIANFF